MMSNFVWSKRSLRELDGIHPDLRRVTDLALKYSEYDFIITDGLRTIEEQKKHVLAGASKTMHSRHLTGHAVDFAPLVFGKVRWEWQYCKAIANAFKQAANELGISIVWGGDWGWDGPHIELDRRIYA